MDSEQRRTAAEAAYYEQIRDAQMRKLMAEHNVFCEKAMLGIAATMFRPRKRVECRVVEPKQLEAGKDGQE